ncbi:hypothetical protein MPH_01570 [Macrophomina phaseolina MS6]|uniref:Uncharacterized protein n=1 Tax=Macrophomina phaseolina (strain MS6) TaxID=1126212 RepID=K2S871_MACPH|nr:hypothetical protein MPH_01570 [Macrophomina phaseolina MS6]
MKEVATISSVHELTGFGHLFLILAALLSEHLYDYIFNNPFFAFNDPEDKRVQSRLRRYSEQVPFSHPRRAPARSAEMARSISKAPLPASPGYATRPHDLDARDSSKKPSRHIELHDIVVEASNLYASVQTQSASFVWQPSSTLLRKPFSIALAHMKPDRYHRLEDEEDPSHDGKPVLILLSPAIEIRGDCGGSNMQGCRILAKASVYLDEKPVPEVKQEGPLLTSP